MTPIKGTPPGPETNARRNPEERNIRKQLARVSRYMAKSTNANIRNSWESRIAVYKGQLAKAEARARFIK
jgi:hypothetical protein